GEVSATPGLYAAYASGNVDGSQNPKMVLEYACATDANGLITFGDVSTGEEYGQKHLTAPAFSFGDFRSEDLPQSGVGAIDATAITNGLGRLLEGSVVTGQVRVGV